MTRYIFVTGGVFSSIGKGITSANIGALLQSCGFKINIKKVEPYINNNPGYLHSSQHGEVFVTDDGYEADLDFGHYERFTGVQMSKKNNTTTGQIYAKILEAEQKGFYKGETIQVIPHVTDVIKEYIISDNDDCDFVICEIGGTVGDIEGLPFYEACRQLRFDLGFQNTCFVHLTYVPYIKVSSELKTKPTQHSVKTLQSFGIQPDILVCRAEIKLEDKDISKIASFCNVKYENVISALDIDNIYKLPLAYHDVHLDTQILVHFGINDAILDLRVWGHIYSNIDNANNTIKLALVGEFMSSPTESYKSIHESIKHAGIIGKTKIDIIYIESRNIGTIEDLKIFDGIRAIVMAGDTESNINGRLLVTQYAREKDIPFLGICFGMQSMIMEYGKNILKMPNYKDLIKKNDNFEGEVIRLGARKINLKEGSIVRKLYNDKEQIEERHKHQSSVDNKFVKVLEEAGMLTSGFSEDGIVESCEIKDRRFFVGVQFHPEWKSKPFSPSCLFTGLIKEAL